MQNRSALFTGHAWWWFRLAVTSVSIFIAQITWHPLEAFGAALGLLSLVGIGLVVSAVMDAARWSYRRNQ